MNGLNEIKVVCCHTRKWKSKRERVSGVPNIRFGNGLALRIYVVPEKQTTNKQTNKQK
jgi:hypothetical protein